MIVEQIAEKVKLGQRIDFEEALALYYSNDLLLLGNLARKVKEAKTQNNVYYNVNQHINLTNICMARCPLCAFSCSGEQKQAYAMEIEDVFRIVTETRDNMPDVTEIHIVSALHPTKPFSFYLDVVKQVKAILPHVHLKAFTPVEIVHFAKLQGISVGQVLTELKAAGLDSLPGGGAEILDDGVRQVICPKKATTAEWIEVMKTAHRLAIPTNATMLYGHVETVEQRLQHLFTLRDIQDETGGFQAFVSFPFHPENTQINQLKRVSAWEDLKTIAMSRIILDNFDHIKAFWMMLTLPVAQMTLGFGVDDLDGTVGEEKIVHAAGAKTAVGITKQGLEKMVRETGYTPIERDTFYHPVQK